MHIHSLKRAALAACAAAALAAPATPAAAARVESQLRVEAGGAALDHGNRYLNDTATIRTSTRSHCGGSGDKQTVNGPTALGIVDYAADYNRRLRPFQVSDQFDFGLFVCGIGGYPGSATAFWLYKVNHVEATVGADQYQLRRGDEVLWYFVNTETGANTGKELLLEAARQRVRAGKRLDVRVLEADAEGNTMPAEGVRLTGGDDARTNAAGKALVVFDEPGVHRLRGVRGSDIPTRAQRFCVWEESRSECRRFTSERIVGTDRRDVIRGGRAPETILGRRRNDRIRSRGGGIDRVRCGRGRDKVKADKRDRVAKNCERVRRR